MVCLGSHLGPSRALEPRAVDGQAGAAEDVPLGRRQPRYLVPRNQARERETGRRRQVCAHFHHFFRGGSEGRGRWCVFFWKPISLPVAPWAGSPGRRSCRRSCSVRARPGGERRGTPRAAAAAPPRYRPLLSRCVLCHLPPSSSSSFPRPPERISKLLLSPPAMPRYTCTTRTFAPWPLVRDEVKGKATHTRLTRLTHAPRVSLCSPLYEKNANGGKNLAHPTSFNTRGYLACNLGSLAALRFFSAQL